MAWRRLGRPAVVSLLKKFKGRPAGLICLSRLRARMDAAIALICQVTGLEVFITAPSARLLIEAST